MLQYRQGEICLTQVSVEHGAPTAAKRQVVLGHGESGNTHVLVGKDVQWLVDAVDDINAIERDGARAARGELFLRVPQGGTIRHSETNPLERHREIVVEPGLYRVTVDREQLPWGDEARMIAD